MPSRNSAIATKRPWKVAEGEGEWRRQDWRSNPGLYEVLSGNILKVNLKNLRLKMGGGKVRKEWKEK